jgi:hypothetical protein
VARGGPVNEIMITGEHQWFTKMDEVLYGGYRGIQSICSKLAGGKCPQIYKR